MYLERETYDDARAFVRRMPEGGASMLEAWWEIGRAYGPERSRFGANRFNLRAERCGRALAEAGTAALPHA